MMLAGSNSSQQLQYQRRVSGGVGPSPSNAELMSGVAGGVQMPG